MISGRRLEKAVRSNVKVAINLFPPARRLAARIDHLKFEVNRLESERTRLEQLTAQLEKTLAVQSEENIATVNRLETERNRLEAFVAHQETTLAARSAAVDRLDGEIAHLRGEHNTLLEDRARFRWMSQHSGSPGQN